MRVWSTEVMKIGAARREKMRARLKRSHFAVGRKYSSQTFRPQIQLLMTRSLTESASDGNVASNRETLVTVN
jgi:hypothetical protein